VRKLFAIAWKDAVNRFSSPSELLFFLILPIVFTVLLAGGTGQQDEDNRARLLVVDEASTPLSAQFVAELEKSEAVRPDVLPREIAEEEFSDGAAPALLVIPPGFSSDDLKQGSAELELRQQPNSLNAQVVERGLMAVSDRIGNALDIAKQAVIEAERVRAFLGVQSPGLLRPVARDGAP
jgi:hypothetical protein